MTKFNDAFLYGALHKYAAKKKDNTKRNIGLGLLAGATILGGAGYAASQGMLGETAEKGMGAVTKATRSGFGKAKDVAKSVKSTSKDVAKSVKSTSKDVAKSVKSTSRDIGDKVHERVSRITKSKYDITYDNPAGPTLPKRYWPVDGGPGFGPRAPKPSSVGGILPMDPDLVVKTKQFVPSAPFTMPAATDKDMWELASKVKYRHPAKIIKGQNAVMRKYQYQ